MFENYNFFWIVAYLTLKECYNALFLYGFNVGLACCIKEVTFLVLSLEEIKIGIWFWKKR